MANLSPVAIILIGVGIGVVALLIGYFLGTRFGGKKSVAMREAKEKHDSYKNDVREHFEQTSAIMSRMVEDYRDMYQHMAEGADKLADIHREKHVTPPPEPEAITEAPTDSGNTGDAAAQTGAPETSKRGEKHASVGSQPGRADQGAPATATGSTDADDKGDKDSTTSDSDNQNADRDQQAPDSKTGRA